MNETGNSLIQDNCSCGSLITFITKFSKMKMSENNFFELDLSVHSKYI